MCNREFAVVSGTLKKLCGEGGKQDRRGRHGRGDKCLSGLGLSRHAAPNRRAVASCKLLIALAFARAVRDGLPRSALEPRRG